MPGAVRNYVLSGGKKARCDNQNDADDAAWSRRHRRWRHRADGRAYSPKAERSELAAGAICIQGISKPRCDCQNNATDAPVKLAACRLHSRHSKSDKMIKFHRRRPNNEPRC